MSVPCISLAEAFAEKFRAALSRLDVAIRDFFDLDYAVRKLKLKPDDALIAMAKDYRLPAANGKVSRPDAGRSAARSK